MQGINTQKYNNIFLKDVFSSMFVVCLFRDFMNCLRLCARPGKVQPKRQNRKEKGCRVYTHPCYALAVSYKLAKPSCLCKRISYWKSRVYMVNPCHVIGSKHTVYFAWYKIKGADVGGSIKHVTLLINRFTVVHHLCFGNKWISILFSRFFLYHGHFKDIGV